MSKTFLEALTSVGKNLQSEIDQLDENVKQLGSDGGSGGTTKANNSVNIRQFESFKTGDDWSSAFSKAFEHLETLGGGTVSLPIGTFLIRNPINMKSNILIQGQGTGLSFIKLADGCDCNMIVFDNPLSDGKINNVINCGITSVTLLGNGRTTNPSVEKYGIVIGRPGLENSLNNGSMPGLNISKIAIESIGGSGIRCYPNTWVYTLSNITIKYCTDYGIYYNSTDNQLTDFYIVHCGKSGVYCQGANTKFFQFKVLFCGETGSDNTYEKSGFYAYNSSRLSLLNIDCQENFFNGFVFNGCSDITVTNLLSDANGYQYIDSAGNSDAYGYLFIKSENINGNITASSFKSTLSQKEGCLIESNCKAITLNYQSARQPVPSENYGYNCCLISPKETCNLYSNQLMESMIVTPPSLENIVHSTSDFFNNSTNTTEITWDNNQLTFKTNWNDTSPRLQFKNFDSSANQRYLFFAEAHAESNYKLRVKIYHNSQGNNYSQIALKDFNIGQNFSDINFVFTNDVDCTDLSMHFTDYNIGNTTIQAVTLKNIAIINITDIILEGYNIDSIILYIKQNYFMSNNIK